MKRFADMNTEERLQWGDAEGAKRREDLRAGPLEMKARAANRAMEIGCTYHAAETMVRNASRRQRGMRV